jgi:hypothetical protein
MYQLDEIKKLIEAMDKHYQVEILNILVNDQDTTINENNNGVFVNLSDMSQSTLEKLEKHIKYVKCQENTLNILENKKDTLETVFFTNIVSKSNKDILSCNDNIKI